MGKTSQKILLLELEQYLKSKYLVIEKEKMMKDVIKTDRRFRYDYFIPSISVVCEINGGSYIPRGRHTYGKGYETDLTKMNMTQFHGIKYFQFTYDMLAKQDYKNYL
jgi:hypothetical protein